MLSGVKFIPREKIDKVQGDNSDSIVRDRKRSSSRKQKNARKKKSSQDSSSDDDLERIKKGSRKKKHYSSDEYLSSHSSESESGSSYDDRDENKYRNRKKGKKTKGERPGDDAGGKSKKRSRGRRKHYSSEGYSSASSESEGGDENSDKEDRRRRGSKKHKQARSKERANDKKSSGTDMDDDSREPKLDVVRKEMGLEWMLRPADDAVRKSTISDDHQPEVPQTEEVKRSNPRELNPYMKDNGSGYPEEEDEIKASGDKLLRSSVVGDGGASWRLKALKRAQEQAAREGRKLEEVAGERWGSLGQLAVSVSSGAAAPFRAHLHAIHHRKRGQTDDHQTLTGNQNERSTGNQNERSTDKNTGRDYLKDVSLRHPEMKAPKVRDSLSWGKRRNQNTSEAGLVSDALSGLNKFENDGSFLREFDHQHNRNPDSSLGSSTVHREKNVDQKLDSAEIKQPSGGGVVKQALSANQLAAKVLQLRMKGKHKEAEELLEEAEHIKANQNDENETIRPRNDGGTSRFVMQNKSSTRRKEDDADMHLAQKIAQNKKFSISGQADDEYDFDDGPKRKTRKKGGSSDQNNLAESSFAKRILTQQERCQFCFENPKRPKHLILSIANFTYLMLPLGQPIVPGHCCILPMQHDSATRTVDNNVWDEIRNFKKCLIMMFAKQEKDVVFLETVMGLAQQRRHCLIECIPIPQDIAKEAPLYFKKAIDEAEDEWSQHNAKKLIDTSVKGLRGSIPKDFPYFHVEFGLNKGFVHVIDDEKEFKSNFGLNVLRGMLQLPEEDMYRRRRHESVEAQKNAVASFARDWQPFDWTKQLG